MEDILHLEFMAPNFTVVNAGTAPLTPHFNVGGFLPRRGASHAPNATPHPDGINSATTLKWGVWGVRLQVARPKVTGPRATEQSNKPLFILSLSVATILPRPALGMEELLQHKEGV